MRTLVAAVISLVVGCGVAGTHRNIQTVTPHVRTTRTRKGLLVLTVLLSQCALLHAQAPADPASAATEDNSGAATNAAVGSPAIRFDGEGLVFSTKDEAYQLTAHGYIQADDRLFYQNVHGREVDKFLLRRIRPLLEGTIFKVVDFRFMPDFGEGNSQIQEAYLELKSFRFAKPRIGKFKEPVGLEVLRSDRELTFAERSLASDLLPLRYMGAQVAGSVLSDSVSYEIGYFNGTFDGSNGTFEWIRANEAAGRLFFHPFAETRVRALRRWGIGVGGSSGEQSGRLGGIKTMGQGAFFTYAPTSVANGEHNRISPQTYYYLGPVGLMGEYVVSSLDVLNKSTNEARRLKHEAWEVTGSIVLTGEKNGYNGVAPRNPFELGKGWRHWGAVELAARYSELQIDRSAFPAFADPKTSAQKAAEHGVGVNWYLDRYIKLVMDYEHTTFRMASGAVTPLHSENVLMNRIQLAF